MLERNKFSTYYWHGFSTSGHIHVQSDKIYFKSCRYYGAETFKIAKSLLYGGSGLGDLFSPSFVWIHKSGILSRRGKHIWCTRRHKRVHSEVPYFAPRSEGFVKSRSRVVSWHISFSIFQLFQKVTFWKLLLSGKIVHMKKLNKTWILQKISISEKMRCTLRNKQRGWQEKTLDPCSLF